MLFICPLAYLNHHSKSVLDLSHRVPTVDKRCMAGILTVNKQPHVFGGRTENFLLLRCHFIEHLAVRTFLFLNKQGLLHFIGEKTKYLISIELKAGKEKLSKFRQTLPEIEKLNYYIR